MSGGMTSHSDRVLLFAQDSIDIFKQDAEGLVNLKEQCLSARTGTVLIS